MSGADTDERADRYTCGLCGQRFVVPTLARWHEDHHHEEDQ